MVADDEKGHFFKEYYRKHSIIERTIAIVTNFKIFYQPFESNAIATHLLMDLLDHWFIPAAKALVRLYDVQAHLSLACYHVPIQKGGGEGTGRPNPP